MTIENRQKIKKLLKDGKKVETIIRLLQGDRGISGKDGRNGTDGLKGRNGKDGTDGINGLKGTEGKDGKDGLKGDHGENGLKGAEGKDGEDGINGEKGEKGDKGDQGDRGSKGHGGISGGGISDHWKRTGTVLSPKIAGDDVSLEFGDLVSEQNPDGYDAIRLKGTESDVDMVLGALGYFNIWNAAENNVFNVDDSGNTVIQGYLDMNSHRINELKDPALDQDAATKKYVDDSITVPVLHVQDQKASSTAGGTSSAGMNIRVLNTIRTNTITGASLASNQITLPAGSYKITASAPAFKSAGHRIYLYNTTDVADEVLGVSCYSATADIMTTHSLMTETFTIAGTKVFELRHSIFSAFTTNGLGVGAVDGKVEIYADVFIEKIG